MNHSIPEDAPTAYSGNPEEPKDSSKDAKYYGNNKFASSVSVGLCKGWRRSWTETSS